MSGLILPVGLRRMASWQTHINRGVPSTEPGTDFYCPIGTRVVAPADGVIWGSGTTIGPATGRWVGVDFDNGMSFRALHASALVRAQGRVKAGDLLMLSGASGYGEEDWSWNPETGGAHTHVTLWPTHEHRYGYRSPGVPYTIDFMDYADLGSPADSGDATPFDPTEATPETPKGYLAIMATGIVKASDDYERQFALGPRGKVLLNGQTADLLNRRNQYFQNNLDADMAGGMSEAEMDLLIRDVLSKTE